MHPIGQGAKSRPMASGCAPWAAWPKNPQLQRGKPTGEVSIVSTIRNRSAEREREGGRNGNAACQLASNDGAWRTGTRAGTGASLERNGTGTPRNANGNRPCQLGQRWRRQGLTRGGGGPCQYRGIPLAGGGSGAETDYGDSNRETHLCIFGFGGRRVHFHDGARAGWRDKPNCN